MEFTSIKNKSEIILEGIVVEVERQDGVIRAVTLIDKGCNVLKIAHADYTGLKLMIPTKPKQVEKFAVKGEVAGLTVSETFDDKYEAEARVDQLNRSRLNDTKVEVKSVLVDEDIPF